MKSLHQYTARIERAIVVDEHARYSAHESGNLQREAELELDLEHLKRSYFKYTGHCFHHSPAVGEVVGTTVMPTSSRDDNVQSGGFQ